MFEIDEDIDVDDEFLNVVFESEERDNNNKLQRSGKLNTGTSVGLNIPSVIRDCLVTQDSSHARPTTCPNIRHSENHLHEFNNLNTIHQPGNSNVGNKENKRKQASPPPSRSKRERKFPGPAGLLPDRKSSRGTPLKIEHLPEVESPSVSTPEELCSQGCLSGSVLEEGPWQSLVEDLGPHADVLDVVNVASVKRKAAARCFVGRKVPLLAAVLHHLDVSSADPCIILRDSTGEIHGTLHREVWQQFAAELVVGSVLVIRNVGLLSTGISSRRHYLNITANNLATIYSGNPERAQKRELHSLTQQDFVRTIEHWRSLMAPPRTTECAASPLFNTSLSSSCSSPAQSPLLDFPQLLSKPHESNMRPATTLINRGNGTPQYPRAIAQSRPMGKNLFPSFTDSNNPVPTCASNSKINCNLSSANTPSYNKNQTNPSFNRSTLNNSLLSNSLQKSNTTNVQRTHITQNPAVNSFKFDPVILKTKTSNSVVFPLNNIENQSTSMSGYRKNCDSSLGNSPKIISSQSSQLTVEEQSVVESVFDGIDVDSLFDDDF